MKLDSAVLRVPVEEIIPNRFQPRLNFDEKALQELSDSIKQHGIIQPLVLRKLGDKYEIIAGERRYKAAQMAGLTEVPAVIADIDDNTSAEVALIENIQRKDLSSIEEAKSYKNILDKGYLTQEELAVKMGVSQSAIANKLRLLNLCEEVQDALMNEKISERHARALLSLDSEFKQKKWLDRILNERLTVRQLDLELKKELGKDVSSPAPMADNSIETNITPQAPVTPEIVMPAAPTPEVTTPTEIPVIENTISTPTPEVVNENEEIISTPEMEDIPLVNINPNIDDIKANATDIDATVDISVPGVEPVQNKSRFFNTLEDEAVNMNFSNPEPTIVEPVEESLDAPIETPVDDGIEMLDDDFNIPVASPTIEPVVEGPKVLYSEAVLDIKNKIYDLNTSGYDIKIEESDLPLEYQIVIKINKE